ncbi:type II secretion system protein, partial [Photobacterium damselae]|nr:type II secretion system protein [Photobacterium damselae]
MKIQTRQRGFGLIEIVLALGIISLALGAYIPWQARQEQRKVGLDYAAYVSRVISGVQEYQYWQISRDPNISAFNAFPAHLRDLMKNRGQWWAECSENDYKQKKCLIPDEVPWNSGFRIKYNRVESNGDEPAFARITLPLRVIPAKERGYWKGPLIALPYAKEQTNGDIQIKIYDPMLSQFYKKAFDSFIKKDGSTNLTGDWDVGGNHAILNAKGLSVNIGGGYQQRVDAGVVGAFMARPDGTTRIAKHRCAAGLKAVLMVGVASNGGYSESKKFAETGAFKASYEEYRGGWKLTYNQYVKKILPNGTLRWEEYKREGQLNVLRLCIPNGQR